VVSLGRLALSAAPPCLPDGGYLAAHPHTANSHVEMMIVEATRAARAVREREAPTLFNGGRNFGAILPCVVKRTPSAERPRKLT